jgi:SAM-dependent methyltransferase
MRIGSAASGWERTNGGELPPGWEQLLTCVACGEKLEDLSWRLDGGGDGLSKCAECTLVHSNPRPTRAEIGKFYPDDYGCHGERRQGPVWRFLDKVKAYKGGYPSSDPIWMRYVMRAVTPLLGGLTTAELPFKRPGARLLDVGCGGGDILVWAQARGWRVSGLDPSARAVATARSRGMTDMRVGDLESTAFEADSFDAIIMSHSLEHVHDPLAAIRKCRRILRPDAMLLIWVPNFDSVFRRATAEWWCNLDLPRHLFHFDSRSLTRLLASGGFAVEKVAYMAWPISLVLNARSLCGILGHEMRQHGVLPSVALISRVMRRMPGAWVTSRLGDVMMVSARPEASAIRSTASSR